MPVILGGDFNEGKTEAAWAVLETAGFTDAWRAAALKEDGGCWGNTYHGFYPNIHASRMNAAAAKDTEHVDWILFRQPQTTATVARQEGAAITPSQIAVITEQQRAGFRTFFPSDHFPVLVTFVVH
jgi:endonuclease/exonuclease/phosphatase family metal-dependent hydrolase